MSRTAADSKLVMPSLVPPAQLFDDPDMIGALERCPKAVPMPYKTYGRSTPAAFSGTIYEKVETLFESMGVFS